MAKHDTAKKEPHRTQPVHEAETVQVAPGRTEPLAPPGEADAAGTSDAAEVETSGKSSENTATLEVEQEIGALKELAARKEAEVKEHYDRLTYMAAEFVNFRRRTLKEKERLFSDAVVEVTAQFLPVMDNLERAIKAAEAVESAEAILLRDGVGMVVRQFEETLAKLGVTEIDAQGNAFDPNLHNAVMHAEDEAFGPNTVADVFQKGYRFKEETVVRHAMVKVVN